MNNCIIMKVNIMFYFLHGYSPDTWDAQMKAGLIRENAGIRFCQSLEIDENLKFNRLARKDGDLYHLVKEKRCPLYIDRLQGGCYIEDYAYDRELLEEYKALLGDNFWGFQMHEWLSNYRGDLQYKLEEIPANEWTAENIKKVIYEKFPGKHLFLEAMTLEEFAASGKPTNFNEFFRNMTDIYKKRQELGELVPCDSAFLAYQFEISTGTKRIMPEVGAQTADARLQICYARGMTRKTGRSFGVYYEPWGGDPFSTCMYNSLKNEWGIDENSDFPFKTAGSNGGSSRSLQKRIFLYAYLNNAEFVSEEWGLYNTFLDCESFELSPYGQVKKDFLDFVDKYQDMGEKLAPVAVVLPKELMVFDNCYDEASNCRYPETSEMLAAAKRGVRAVFTQSEPMLGTEQSTLKNSIIPDAIDLLNRDDDILSRYEYLIDLTSDPDFSKTYAQICTPEDLPGILKELLPCYVDGGLHWLVNHCTRGGYYLSVFNHSGVVRRVSEGEYTLPEAQKTVSLTFQNHAVPTLCEGDGFMEEKDGTYMLTVPAGGYALIYFNP